MTRDEGVAMIQQVLGFRTDLTDTIVTNLKLAQQQLELGPTKPWFMLSEESTTVTEDGEERVEIPSDFIKEYNEEGLTYIPDDTDVKPVQLRKDDLDTLRANFLNVVPGPPEAYSLEGNYFRIFPEPDDAYTIRMLYYKQQTVLSTNVENNWLKYNPYLLLGTAGMQVAGSLRDANALQVFQGWLTAGLKILNGHDTDRGLSNRALQMGGPH